MKTQKTLALKHLVILATALFAGQALATQEIPDAGINDIATSATVNGEAVIRYHPELCNTLGDQVCKFFISRQYGHIALKHNLGGNYTFEEEKAADCWVVQNAPLELSKAAYTHFNNGGYMGHWPYGSGPQRALSLLECPADPVTQQSLAKDNSDEPASQIKPKGHFDHYLADLVFADVQKRYPSYFPKSSTYAWEYNSNGHIIYMISFYNGSALAETGRKGFWYKIQGGDWKYWGPIASWF